MFKKREKGFTLIELMVVIAIIAILATVVLVALQGARDAAEDSNRKAAIAQVRSLANVVYGISPDTGFAELPGDDEVSALQTKYDSVDNGLLEVYADGDDYCATINLKASGALGHFCVDNENAPADYAAKGCAAGSISCE